VNVLPGALLGQALTYIWWSVECRLVNVTPCERVAWCFVGTGTHRLWWSVECRPVGGVTLCECVPWCFVGTGTNIHLAVC